MKKATYWQRGEALDYKNSGQLKIEANTIVAVGDITGVIGADILPGETGSLHIAGVFEMPKKTSSEVIDMGKKVYFDGVNGITATAGTNTYAGIAAAATSATDDKILVKLG